MDEFRELFDYTNAQLRGSGDMVVVFRTHFTWNDIGEEIIEPVALAKQQLLPFIYPRLKNDARDLLGVSFHYWDVNAVTSETLDEVKAHLRLEDEIDMYLRGLRRSLRASLIDPT